MSDWWGDWSVLNSPYEYPGRHWELDSQGQPTQQIIIRRRRAEFAGIYPIEADFEAKVAVEFDRMIAAVVPPVKSNPCPPPVCA
jgi:hypothetical protein